MDVIRLRLANQRLVGKKFTKPEQVVDWFGAVQAQDYPAAKWSIGLRLKNATDSDLEKAFNQGRILRTHVMRPTWHFVMPEDIRWMLQLTAPRVKTFMGHYNRKLKLDEKVFTKTNAVILKALRGHKYLTRQELKKILLSIGITTDVQRLAHIIMWAELDGLICSGPRRGKQFTYALLEERVPKAKALNRTQALAKLARKYFTSHGPAQLKDFSWWSGLSMKEAQEGLNLIKPKLIDQVADGKTYWFSADAKTLAAKSPSALLLSIYDEFTIAYKDRSDMSKAGDIEKMISLGNALTAVMVLNGNVIGTWKRVIKKDEIISTAKPFRKLTKSEKELFQASAQRYGTYWGMPATLSLSSSGEL